MNKKINIDVARFVVSFLVIAIHISPFININQEFNFFFTRILGRIAITKKLTTNLATSILIF